MHEVCVHLSDLDLDVVGGGEVVGVDAEAAGGNLLDGGTEGVGLVVDRLHAAAVLAALAAVALAADLVHRLYANTMLLTPGLYREVPTGPEIVEFLGLILRS